MYYNKEHLGDRTSRMEKAVQLLLKAIETDPNSGAAWYLIGRYVQTKLACIVLARNASEI